MTSRKTILVLVHSKTQLNELLRASRVLRNSGRYNVSIFSDVDYAPLLSYISNRCRAEGFDFVDRLELLDQVPLFSPYGIRSRLVLGLIYVAGLAPSLMFPLAEKLGFRGTRLQFSHALSALLGVIRADQRDFAQFKTLFQSKGAAALLVAEDGVDGSASAMQAAAEKRIPVIDLPYEYSTRAQLLRGTAKNPPEKEPMERILLKWFPRWVIRRDPPVLTASRADVALARQLEGLAPPDPTTVHGGRADCLVVESPEMRAHYLREGIPHQKLKDVGSLALDDVHAALQRNPIDAIAFETGSKRVPGRTSILCAIVPDYVEKTGPACEFESYRDLLDFWIDTLLAASATDVTFQCHPGVDADARSHLRSRVALSEEGLDSLIPACDVFVTSVSSTIRWAIAARKPVVNYDVYRFSYPDYVGAPGVIHAATRAQFTRSVRALVEDDAFYEATTADLRARGFTWGAMDGKAGERFLELMDGLVLGRQNQPGSG